MSYQPLATKYRPERFEDLVGQEAVAKAIAGAISLNRLHHSIIFSGVRGIGKTTTARLLAKALNCEQGPTPQPCGRCSSCVAITLGNHQDVLEIDGASNNSVDEVRALKEAVGYVAQRSKYKVYIIDEVHMLSMSAFNALLKTLEEPPPDVVFIFATTELHKVPATVVGRCLTFTLKKMTVETIASRIEHILKEERIPYEAPALQIIAREGNGSMRDALTFLDQVIAIGNGEVRRADLEGLVSNLSSSPILQLLRAMLHRKGKDCIDIIDRMDQSGARFGSIVDDAAKFARHIFILRELGKDSLNVTQLGLSDEEINHLADLATEASTLDANRIFRTLMQCRGELDGSDLDRFVFENFVLEWCFDPGLPQITDLLRDQEGGVPGSTRVSAAGVQPATVPLPQLLDKAESIDAPKDKPRSLLTREFLQEIKGEVKAKTEPPMHARVESPSSPLSAQVSTAEVPANLLQADPSVVGEKSPVKEPHGVNNHGRVFPSSWRELVDIWKQVKPLQARKLEEVHPIQYSPQKIVVAVDPQGMIGPILLLPTTQKSIEKVFGELFAFTGEFTAIEKSQAGPFALREPVQQISSPVMPLDTDPSPTQRIHGGREGRELPRSILEDRASEKLDKRSALLNYAREHELTREVLSEFSGKIVDIRITNPALAD